MKKSGIIALTAVATAAAIAGAALYLYAKESDDQESDEPMVEPDGFDAPAPAESEPDVAEDSAPIVTAEDPAESTEVPPEDPATPSTAEQCQDEEETEQPSGVTVTWQ